METVAYICMETSYNSINVLVAKAECGHALKGLALPCASHIGEIALEGSRRVRSTLAGAPVRLVPGRPH